MEEHFPQLHQNDSFSKIPEEKDTLTRCRKG